MNSDSVTVSLYEHSVPSFMEAEMDRLYEHIHSSLAQFRVYGNLADATSTYVVRKDGKVTTALLFQISKTHVRVLNEQISIDSQELERFANHIFTTYKSVHRITFHAIRGETATISFPHQRFNCTEDIVVNLPATREKYLASLGKNTRRNIKRYTDRLMRCFPSFRYEFYEHDAVSAEQLQTIIGFNRARMAGKQKVSTIDDDEAERIVQLAQTCGVVGIATIDGRICAGGIGYRAGENYFLNVIAHDPAYDDYWIGVLCSYLTICECIARGCKEFHFLWGRYEYKFALGAVQRDLDHLVIYRSRVQLFLNGVTASRIACTGYIRMAKFWMLDQARQQGSDRFPARAAVYVVTRLRSLKRTASGMLAQRKKTISLPEEPINDI
ncbi:GNAT family N-acetyltransferase [Noviherbaspirillum cavernae]|uniref:GNAT family N-acetyltransferase n=1 Tax=Noviherbaspirillum cavernae TaxID=2320862 RepID=A0A418X3G0_9BURK|nr:GNAT family N-acetyltransferase [Noviherbaspirillum cavernae]RJG06993.1 GNAT family N-acetyltransferase [Noviherbaspirillum cavernae]